VSYRWGLKDAKWNNRFEFVLRAKLNLVGQENFWAGCPGGDGLDRLAWLVYQTLNAPSSGPLTWKNIPECLKNQKDRVLLLLDGFDEVVSLYERDTVFKNLMTTAMSFPNGVLTAASQNHSCKFAAQHLSRKTTAF